MTLVSMCHPIKCVFDSLTKTIASAMRDASGKRFEEEEVLQESSVECLGEVTSGSPLLMFRLGDSALFCKFNSVACLELDLLSRPRLAGSSLGIVLKEGHADGQISVSLLLVGWSLIMGPTRKSCV